MTTPSPAPTTRVRSASASGASAADPFARLSPDVRVAWEESFMAEFEEATVATLLEDAREVTLDAGEIFYRGSHHADMVTLALVVEGLLRVVVGDHESREMTLRYATNGAVVGLPAVILGGAPPNADRTTSQWLQVGGGSLSGEALQESRILKLSPGKFRRLAAQHADIAWPLARYLSRENVATQQLLAAGVFLPVRARVARHVLDLSSREEGNLVVRATHQEIANAIGTVREVVSRVLRALQAEGMVTRNGDALVLSDSAALHTLSTGRDRVVPQSLPQAPTA